jgi:membrane protein DedA with SNARE-associated domain
MDWQSLLQQYGYFLLFFILIIEGQPFIILAGFLVYLGYFSFWKVIIIGLPALILGDILFHWLAYKWGGAYINKHDRFLFINTKLFLKLNKLFEKHGGKILFFTKFIYGLGRNIIIVAGLSGRPYRHLFKYNLLSTAASIIFFTFLGYLFGTSYYLLEDYIKGLGLAFIGLIILILVIERLGIRKFIYPAPQSRGHEPEETKEIISKRQ